MRDESRELLDARAQNLIRQRHVKIADRADRARVTAGYQLTGMPGHHHGESSILVIVGFGMLVDIEKTGVIEQGAVFPRESSSAYREDRRIPRRAIGRCRA